MNIHAINFSVRLEEFRAQMDQIGSVGEVHSGPVILSGDFNTWRQARFEVVSELADDLGAKQGLSRRNFLRTNAGMAAAFLAMNEVFILCLLTND